MNNGLSFVAFSLSMLGALTVFVGGAFAFIAIDKKAPASGLTGLWHCSAECTWPRLVGNSMKLPLAWLDKAVLILFEEADKKPFLNILFLGLVIIFIPLAAAINALLGGSPLLFKSYLMLMIGMIVLAGTSQFTRLKAPINVFNGALSLVVGLGLLLGAPVYVLLSFTERILHDNISHAFLISLLISPFYYVASFSIQNYVELFIGRDPTTGRTPAILFLRRFLAALPVAFVLVFLALLVGQLAVKQQIPVRSVQMLFVSVTIGAISLPSAMCALSPVSLRNGPGVSLVALLNGLVTAMGLSIALLYFSTLSTPYEVGLAGSVNVLFGFDAGGGRIFLGPEFWVMHIPFLPVFGVLAFCIVGVLAKGILRIRGLQNRPNLATAGLLGLLGAGLFLFGRLLI